jgi:hypothetical protein
MPFRKHLKGLFHRDKSRSPGPSRPDTPDRLSSTLTDTNISGNTPLPNTLDHTTSSGFPSAVASPHVPAGTAPIAAAQTVISSPVPTSANIPSVTVSPAPNPSIGTALASPLPISSASPSTIQNVKHTTWSGVKTFLELLNESADAFGPLKSAVGGINRLIEIFEARAIVQPRSRLHD